jgi:integrase
MKKLSKTSVANYLRETRGFLRWLYKRGRITFDHAVALDGPRIARSELVHPRRALKDDELIRLLAAARTRPRTEIETIRNGPRSGEQGAVVTDVACGEAELLGLERRTVYLIAAWTGLRRSELAALQWSMLKAAPDHLDLPGAVTKNGDRAKIFLHPEALTALREWEREFTRLHGPQACIPAARIFRTIPRMKVFTADLAFAGIKYFVPDEGFADFHALRVAFNTRMAVRGLDTPTRQQLMRHSDPKLTDGTYLDANQLRLNEAICGLPPLLSEPK